MCRMQLALHKINIPNYPNNFAIVNYITNYNEGFMMKIETQKPMAFYITF